MHTFRPSVDLPVKRCAAVEPQLDYLPYHDLPASGGEFVWNSRDVPLGSTAGRHNCAVRPLRGTRVTLKEVYYVAKSSEHIRARDVPVHGWRLGRGGRPHVHRAR